MNPRRWVAVAVAISGFVYLVTHLEKPTQPSPIEQLDGALR